MFSNHKKLRNEAVPEVISGLVLGLVAGLVPCPVPMLVSGPVPEHVSLVVIEKLRY